MKTDTTTYNIAVASDDTQVRRCWPAYKELRPHLKSEDELVERWRIQTREGFKIVFVEADDKVAAAAGYRFLNTLAWGYVLYIDDLVALTSHHKKGFGTLLLRHLQEEARNARCNAVHLDTGYQRHLAHLAYLRNGFQFNCHHLAWEIKR